MHPRTGVHTLGGFLADRDRRYRATVTALRASGLACLVVALLLAGVGATNSRFLDALNRDIAPAAAPAEARVLRTFEYISRWQYFDASRITSRWQRWLALAEHASPLHVSARTTLTAGVDHIGPCGSVSRSMIVLLRRAGIEARKALLCDAHSIAMHTVVEVRLDGEWRVFDPTFGWYWRRPADGEIATVADLARDGALFRSVVTQVPQYPVDLYTYDNVHHLRWEKLPGLHWLRAGLVRVGGVAWVRGIGTPYLYERPVYFAALLLSLLGTVLLWLGWRARRRWTRRAQVAPRAAFSPPVAARTPDGSAVPGGRGSKFQTHLRLRAGLPASRSRLHREE